MIEKLIYDDKADHIEPYVEYISRQFAGFGKIPLREVPFPVDFF